MTKDRMTLEAIRRLVQLEISPDVLCCFIDDEGIPMSDQNGITWLIGDETGKL